MPDDDNGYGEYGELEELRELLEDRADDVQELVFLDLGDGDGFANVEIDGEWYGFDLSDFDESLWEEMFDYVEDLGIEYVVYEG